MASGVVDYANKKKECLFLNNVNFEKAFHFVSSGVLGLYMLCRVGFSRVWMDWI